MSLLTWTLIFADTREIRLRSSRLESMEPTITAAMTPSLEK